MRLLEIHNLTKKYDNQLVLDNVCLNINKGDVYGLIGKNGAGKTTLFKLLEGSILSDEGEIYWGTGDSKNIKVGICIAPERINKSLTAFQTLSLYGNSIAKISRREIDNILKLVGLYEQRNKKIAKFSTGMKQKLILAIALLDFPDILILDEPLNGLDPSSVREIRDLLYKLNKEKEVTMIISSHILGELTKISTRYGLLVEGKLVKEFSAMDISDMNEDEKELYILRTLEEMV